MPNPKRSEIWLVNFDPSKGAEVQKSRPAVVVSDNSIGKLPLKIVVPVTEWNPRYEFSPWFVKLRSTQMNGLSKDSGADAFQVKSVSLSRFVKRLGAISSTQIGDIAAAVALCVGFQ